MSKYRLSDDYVRKEEEIIRGMTLQENRKISMKYIKPDSMVYLVVGDAAIPMKSQKKSVLENLCL
jgi:zinc protease